MFKVEMKDTYIKGFDNFCGVFHVRKRHLVFSLNFYFGEIIQKEAEGV